MTSSYPAETTPWDPVGDLDVEECFSRDVFDLIGSRWSVMVIGRLDLDGPHRFGQLKRALPDVSQKSLTQALRRLERDGLVSRTVLAEKRPPQVEYALTDLGWTVTKPLREIVGWVEDHMVTVVEARAAFDKRESD